MAQPAIDFDFKDLEKLAKGLSLLDGQTLGETAMRVVNVVAKRGFDESRRQMLTGVALNESYVKERMTVEEAKDPQEPTAAIIAFRPGGQRKPATKPVNLRQYNPLRVLETNNWSNSGIATDSGRAIFATGAGGAPHRKRGMGPNPQGAKFYENPRKPGAYLPFIPRTGNRILGVPQGQKVQSISVEVVRGARKQVLPNSQGFAPFMQRMPNGEVFVMRRTTKNGGKGNKGKIEALHSLSVWQLFNFAKAKVIPLIMRDLESTVVDEFTQEIEKAVNL